MKKWDFGAVIGIAIAGCAPSRDVVPVTHDVRIVDGGGGNPVAPDAYVYVARRPHGIVALAEARNLSDEVARRIIDRLADDLEACTRRLEQQGTLVDGAARVVAVAPHGTVDGLNVRVAPGGAVAANALLCVVAPLRAIPFPLGTPGADPALAIETTWQTGRATEREGGTDPPPQSPPP